MHEPDDTAAHDGALRAGRQNMPPPWLCPLAIGKKVRERREGNAFGDHELAVLMRNVAFDVARVDQIGQDTLDLVHVQLNPGGTETPFETSYV